MEGYVIRIKNNNGYLGVDSIGNQEWTDFIPDWNALYPDDTILINDAFECYISSEVNSDKVQRFYEWMKQKEEYKQSKLLFFQNGDELSSILKGYTLLGYDVAFIEDPEYCCRNYFYSSIYHELFNRHIIAVHDSMHAFRSELNQNGLFNNPDTAASYLKCRNELFLLDTDNLFETAYGNAYDVVKVVAM